MIGNILDNTTELCMIKYTFGEIFTSGGATLSKNPSDQTVISRIMLIEVSTFKDHLYKIIHNMYLINNYIPIITSNYFISEKSLS